MADTAYDYLLAKTVVQLTVEEFEVRDRLAGEGPHSVYEAVAALVVVADPTARRTTILPRHSDAQTTSKIAYHDDRRLKSIEASSTGQGPQRLKATMAVGGLLLGAALSLVNPPLGGAVAVAAAGAARSTKRGLGAFPTPAETPDDRALRLYAEEHPDEAEVLTKYRSALPALVMAHADAACDQDLAKLKELTEAIASTRRHAAVIEDHYAHWKLDQVERTSLGVRLVEFDVDQLPTTDELMGTLQTRGVHDTEARLLLDADLPQWAKWARRTGLAISIDYVTPDFVPQSVGGAHDVIRLSYRAAKVAEVGTWAVEHVAEHEERDGGGNVTEVPAHYKVRRKTRQRSRVVRTDAPEVSLSVDSRAWSSGKLSVTLNDTGEPTEIGGDASPLAADAVASLPDNLKTALETGAAVSLALTPGSTSAAYLERQLAIAKNRKDLAGLQTVEQPDASDDQLAKLKEALETAELEARLRIARAQQLNPGAVGVIYDISPASS